MINLSVELFGEKLSNPVIPASGTFGYGKEFATAYDLSILGSISLKGCTIEARYGNELPRIAECPMGMLNAIGLQNPSAESVLKEEIPALRTIYGKKVIVNVGGHSFEDYEKAVAVFNGCEDVLAIELNVSCPNVKGGGMAFGLDKDILSEVVSRVKKVSDRKIIVKLSPNVTDIVANAKAAQDAGADALSLINTLVGMRLDARTGKPILSTKIGGYSGAGVFPIAIRMVYDVYKNVSIPIIGMGGIMSARDVIEMMSAGAKAVMVGTANLINPFACKEIIENLPKELESIGVKDINDIIGRAHRWIEM